MPAAKTSALQTEFDFTLPKGYVDADGAIHREGTMRLSTALDEIAPLRDPQVRANQAYLTVAILSRVITRLGDLPEVNAKIIEGLFTADLAHLQELYRKINSDGAPRLTVTCPQCQHTFQVDRDEPGGS